MNTLSNSFQKKDSLEPSSISEDSEALRWIDKQTLSLDTAMRGVLNAGREVFCQHVLQELAKATQAIQGRLGLFSVKEGEEVLELVVGYAVRVEKKNEEFPVWENNLAMQVCHTKEAVCLGGMEEANSHVFIAGIRWHVGALCYLPLVFNEKLYGVLELSFVEMPEQKISYFLERALTNVSVLLENIFKNEETQALLSQAQKDHELLLVQGEELAKAQEVMSLAYEELSIQTKRIQDSINYAERIQNAILPSEARLRDFFKEVFVIFLPKDYVSGDFYWMAETADSLYLAVVDCTGHGIPGAFMSMIGNTLLNQIILEKGVKCPAKALSLMQKGLLLNLLHDDEQADDGMDLMLCRFIRENNDKIRVKSAGAKARAYALHGQELEVIRGDRHAIGGHNRKELKFKLHTSYLEEGHTFYMFTDGWVDSANAMRQRYGSTRFQKKLMQYSTHPLERQKRLFIKALDAFVGDQDQRDDITLIGVRV